jgi:hypothetical protein
LLLAAILLSQQKTSSAVDSQRFSQLRAAATAVEIFPERSVVLGHYKEAKRDIQQVVDWTREYAESLDPLSDLPDSIDEFVHPERKYSWLK